MAARRAPGGAGVEGGRRPPLGRCEASPALRAGTGALHKGEEKQQKKQKLRQRKSPAKEQGIEFSHY